MRPPCVEMAISVHDECEEELTFRKDPPGKVFSQFDLVRMPLQSLIDAKHVVSSFFFFFLRKRIQGLAITLFVSKDK